MKTLLATLCLSTVALIPVRADEGSTSLLTAALEHNISALAFDTLAEQHNDDLGLTKTGSDAVIDFVSQKAENGPSMFALFEAAEQAEKVAEQEKALIFEKFTQARANLELALEKSLVEREEEKLDADSALPEDRPMPVPFTSSRPECVVSVGNAIDSFTCPDRNNRGLACTPEPSTWALFGCGAFLLFCTLPKRFAKLGIKNKQ